jgi:hypothetical protein
MGQVKEGIRVWYLVMMPFQIDEKHVVEVHEAV